MQARDSKVGKAAEKLAELKARVAILDASIAYKDAKKQLLHLTRDSISDVECDVVPGVEVILPRLTSSCPPQKMWFRGVTRNHA